MEWRYFWGLLWAAFWRRACRRFSVIRCSVCSRSLASAGYVFICCSLEAFARSEPPTMFPSRSFSSALWVSGPSLDRLGTEKRDIYIARDTLEFVTRPDNRLKTKNRADRSSDALFASCIALLCIRRCVTSPGEILQ